MRIGIGVPLATIGLVLPNQPQSLFGIGLMLCMCGGWLIGTGVGDLRNN